VPLTALHDACCEADLDKISSLLESSADINGLDSRGFTPLMTACEKDDRKVVEFLLSKGADIKGDYSVEKSPVSLAIENGSTDMVTLLFDKGVPANGRTKSKTIWGELYTTPLGQAALKGHEALVELILKRGVDINTRQDSRGWTSLHHAIFHRHKAVIRLLLQYGAKMDITNSNGNIPLDPYGWIGHEQESLVILRKILDDWTSKGMYSESAELLAKHIVELKKVLKIASQKGANANSEPRGARVGPTTPQSAHQQPATQRQSNTQPQTSSQPPAAGTLRYLTPQPARQQPAAGILSYPNPQAVYQLPANGGLRTTNPQPTAMTANMPNRQRELNETGLFGRLTARLRR
jgi:hypothetical protein